MSMQEQNLVGEVHPVTLTLYRDQETQNNNIEWIEDQCFKLTFDSPYTQSDYYEPFDFDNPPECTVSSVLTEF